MSELLPPDAIEIHVFRLQVLTAVHFWREMAVVAFSSIAPYDHVGNWLYTVIASS